jgi:hypothetical protein
MGCIDIGVILDGVNCMLSYLRDRFRSNRKLKGCKIHFDLKIIK